MEGVLIAEISQKLARPLALVSQAVNTKPKFKENETRIRAGEVKSSAEWHDLTGSEPKGVHKQLSDLLSEDGKDEMNTQTELPHDRSKQPQGNALESPFTAAKESSV